MNALFMVLNSLTAHWRIALAIAVSIAIFSSGWTIRGWRADAEQKAALEAAIADQAERMKAANAKSEALENKLSELTKRSRIISRRLDHELKSPAYSCPVPVNGVQILRDAVSGYGPGKPDNPMP